MYCIYSGLDVDGLISPEHIIPLSCGGSDKFCIDVSDKYNSKVNHEIDEKIKNDYFVNIERVLFGYTGHHKNHTRTLLDKNAFFEDGEKIELILNSGEISVKFPRYGTTRRIIQLNRYITSTANMVYKVRWRFLAKVALCSGYKLYPANFVKYVDTSLLRNMIFDNMDTKVRLIDPYCIVNGLKYGGGTFVKTIQNIAKTLKQTFVLLGFSADYGMLVFVVIGTHLIGGISIPANSTEFEHDDIMRWDIVRCIDKKNAVFEKFGNIACNSANILLQNALATENQNLEWVNVQWQSNGDRH